MRLNPTVRSAALIVVLQLIANSLIDEAARDSTHSNKELKNRHKLKFKKNHEFVILHITDLHYGESEEKDLKNDAIHERMVDLVKPDLVVNTGDAISGYAWNGKKGFYERNWKRFTEVYRQKNVPYAYTLGNHDREADASLEQIAELEKSHPNSMFDGNTDIDPESLSNYLVHVETAFEEAKDKVAALVWLFDSKKKCFNSHNGNGCINQNQLDWFHKMSHHHVHHDNSKIQGMAFFHVPIKEFIDVFKWEKTFGIKGEHVSCPRTNTGVFNSFRQMGNIRVVGCGHDHNSNYGGNLKGIDLIYGQKTGFGSYGPKFTQRGARVFKLTERLNAKGKLEWSYKTFIVFQDGGIEYPETPHWQGWRSTQSFCPFKKFAFDKQETED